MVTCGTGFGLGLGFGVGVALACRVGLADGALDVPGLLLAAGAAAGVAVHAVARQATAPATNINRMRDSIGTRCHGTLRGLASAMPGARRSARYPVRLRPACPARRPARVPALGSRLPPPELLDQRPQPGLLPRVHDGRRPSRRSADSSAKL